jgi:zinc protease
MWNLLTHCLTDARFPEKEIETERGKVLSTIQRNLDDNFVRPLQLFQRAYYGQHPYGLPETGFEETVKQFTPADLSAWRDRLLSTDRIVIAAVGNFDRDQLLSILQNTLKDIPRGDGGLVIPPPLHVPLSPEQAEQRPKKQTAFVLGFPAPPATNPEIVQYEVLQQILSGMGGRLFINLRSKKSLAYTVYAGTASYLYSGTFLTYIAGDASKERQALEGMWEELEALQRAPVSEEEMQNARNALIGGYALATQGASARLMDYINSYLLGKPMPYAPYYSEQVRAVAADDVLQVARKTFLRDAATLGIIRGTTEQTDAEKLVLA